MPWDYSRVDSSYFHFWESNRRANAVVTANVATGGRKMAKSEVQRLSSGQKRMLEVVPASFVVSDGIRVQNSTAAELATPRYCITTPSLLGDSDASDSDEDCSDAAFEIRHRPSELKERLSNKHFFGAETSRRLLSRASARSPLIRGYPHSGARRAPAVSLFCVRIGMEEVVFLKAHSCV